MIYLGLSANGKIRQSFLGAQPASFADLAGMENDPAVVGLC